MSSSRPAAAAVADGPRPADPPTFSRHLRDVGLAPLLRSEVTTLQVNVGRLCNLACHHCHVEAGPKQTEILQPRVAHRLVELLDRNPGIGVLDLTGGAPEMNPSFRYLVTEARRRQRRVIDRCNLTILLETGYEDLPEFLAANQVEIVASLPCYTADNVDSQRGRGTYEGSIEALRRLNAVGYGRDAGLLLDLVYNPGGASLPGPQAALEDDYRRELAERFGISFTHLLTITNMPIGRFERDLVRAGGADDYLTLLRARFNPATIEPLMCRHQLHVAWDGRLSDCDFNYAMGLGVDRAVCQTIETFTVEPYVARRIATGVHCFGCTAGHGSSCGGALA